MDADYATIGEYSNILATLVSGKGDTFLAAIALAIFSASIGALGYFGKVVVTWISAKRENGRLYRNAKTLFKNDVVIRQHDFKTSHSPEAFELMVRQIIDGGNDFKFAVPSSDDSENEEMMKFIHRMDPNQARLIRTYILYGKLQASIAVVLSTTLADFDKPRKLRALAVYRETSQLVDFLSTLVLKGLNKEWWESHPDYVFDIILERMTFLNRQRVQFIDDKLKLLQKALDNVPPPQSSGGFGPNMVDLQEFVKIAHKIANAYRSFNSSA